MSCDDESTFEKINNNDGGGRHKTKKLTIATPSTLINKQFVRELVQEVMGLAPYQKRIQELLKVGRDKRALKLAKKKLGTHGRAKRCRENMAALLRKARK